MVTAPPRLHPLTVVAVAIVAMASQDLVHELVGHGLASWLREDPILSLSTVALQNARPDRVVAASGTLANAVAGAAALLAMRRLDRFGAGTLFLWLAGAFGLLNCGYLVFSAALGSGDWAAVVSGGEPALAFRLLLGVVGTIAYIAAVRWTTTTIAGFVVRGEVESRDVARMAWLAWLAGGALLTIASVFNPIGPSLIPVAGVGASFGLNAGLLLAGRGLPAPSMPSPREAAQPSAPWLVLALVVGGSFVALLGPGLRF